MNALRYTAHHEKRQRRAWVVRRDTGTNMAYCDSEIEAQTIAHALNHALLLNDLYRADVAFNEAHAAKKLLNSNTNRRAFEEARQAREEAMERLGGAT